MFSLPDRQRIQQCLRTFDFKTLFIEELGWDNLRETSLALAVDGQKYTLYPLVEKRGFKVYICSPDAQGHVPTSATIRQIERELTKHAYEHLIIYVDAARENQVWQWVKREPAKASATRLSRLHKGQSGELLSQKLRVLAFNVEEEDHLGTTVVAARVRQALDAERVTKRFYDRFQKEHATFLTFIEGITSQADREWYASLMLNRLMFVYFIQKKGLLATSGRGELDGDRDYLSHKLKEVQAQYDGSYFYSFYRYFLLRLFHDGLGRRGRSAELEALLGNVPYLNGGLFDVHVLEREHPDIRIADEAFERIFGFFNEFDWYLDDRPLRNDREINPDVLGYIFEKYINQKQMGAYYTKEDITGYISKNTIIPRLLEKTGQECPIAFTPDGFVWSLLRRDPDRYIYEAVKHGCDQPLPSEIEAGIHDVSQRGEWNKPAPEAYALPTETWREVVARRTRYEEVSAKLASGAVTDVNDLITSNLDVCLLAQDVIAYGEGGDLLNAFYASLETITVLDPTCGSGAFLFAALNILEPLYEACLDRMQEMVAEHDRFGALEPQYRAEHLGSHILRFRDTLAQIAKHPNHRYFILKSIIIKNLYGVDIMEEAVEICKLRLFLKLVAQIDLFQDIEPLPDIDFNVRAGNTLIGFATYAEAEHAITSKLDFDNTMERIEQKAQKVEQAFHDFRTLQTAINVDSELMVEKKQQVRSRLSALNDELDRYLASEYGIDRSDIPDKAVYEERFIRWRQSHQPFHWFVEFYGIIQRGGFDVIIGNPPYVEWSKIRSYDLLPGLYTTRSCGNLYTVICERSYELLEQCGHFGMIVPISCVATDRMDSLRSIWMTKDWETHVSHYSGDAHPSVLFQGVKFRLSIVLQRKSAKSAIYSTHFQRWFPQGRENLFALINYVSIGANVVRLGLIPKVSSMMHLAILKKLCSVESNLRTAVYATGPYQIYCHRIVAHFVKALDFIPFFHSQRDGEKKSEDYKIFAVDSTCKRDTLVALLNSNLFYSWFVSYSDVYHCGREMILDFPCDLSALTEAIGDELSGIKSQLMDDLQQRSIRRTIPYKATGLVQYDEFYPRHSKPIIDEIDRALARHYGFTDEELDFIINYDIKYRMGRNDEEDGGE